MVIMFNENKGMPEKIKTSTQLSSNSKRYQSPLGRKRTWDINAKINSPFRRIPEPSPFRAFKTSIISPKHTKVATSRLKITPLSSTESLSAVVKDDGEDIMNWIQSVKQKALNILHTEEKEEKKFYEEIEYQKKLIEAQQDINTESFDRLKIYLDKERSQKQQSDVQDEEDDLEYESEDEPEDSSYEDETEKIEEIEGMLDSESESIPQSTSQEDEYDSEGNIIIPSDAYIHEVSSDQDGDEDQEPQYYKYDASQFTDDGAQYRVTPQFSSLYSSDNPFGDRADPKDPKQNANYLEKNQHKIDLAEQQTNCYQDPGTEEIQDVDEVLYYFSDIELEKHEQQEYEDYSGVSEDEHKDEVEDVNENEPENIDYSDEGGQETGDYNQQFTQQGYDPEFQNIMNNDLKSFEILAKAALTKAKSTDSEDTETKHLSSQVQNRYDRKEGSFEDEYSYDEQEGKVECQIYDLEAEDTKDRSSGETENEIESVSGGENPQQYEDHHSEAFDEELIDKRLLLNLGDSAVVEEETETQIEKEEEGRVVKAVNEGVIQEADEEIKANTEFSKAPVEEPKSFKPDVKLKLVESLSEIGFNADDKPVEDVELESAKETGEIEKFFETQEKGPINEPDYEEEQYYDSEDDVPFQDPSTSMFGGVSQRDLLDTLEAASDEEKINTSCILHELSNQKDEDQIVVDELQTRIEEAKNIRETTPEVKDDKREDQSSNAISEDVEDQTTFVSFFNDKYAISSNAAHSFADVSSEFVKCITSQPESQKSTSSPLLLKNVLTESAVKPFAAIGTPAKVAGDHLESVLGKRPEILVERVEEDVNSIVEEVSKEVTKKKTQLKDITDNSDSFLEAALGEKPDKLLEDVEEGVEDVFKKVGTVLETVSHSSLKVVADSYPKTTLGKTPEKFAEGVERIEAQSKKVADGMLETTLGEKVFDKVEKTEIKETEEAINSALNVSGNPFFTALEESLGETAEEFLDDVTKGKKILEETIGEGISKIKEDCTTQAEASKRLSIPIKKLKNPFSILNKIFSKASLNPVEDATINTAVDFTETDIQSSTPLKPVPKFMAKAEVTDYQDFSSTESILKDNELGPIKQNITENSKSQELIETKEILESDELEMEGESENILKATEIIEDTPEAKDCYIRLTEVAENSSKLLKEEIEIPVRPTEGEIDVDQIAGDVADVILQEQLEDVTKDIVKEIDVNHMTGDTVERVVEDSKTYIGENIDSLEDVGEAVKNIVSESVENSVVGSGKTSELTNLAPSHPDKEYKSPLKKLKDWFSGSKRKATSQEVSPEPVKRSELSIVETEGQEVTEKEEQDAFTLNPKAIESLRPKKKRQKKPIANYQPDHLVIRTRSGKIIGATTEEEVAKAEEILNQEEKLIDAIAHGEVEGYKDLKELATSYEDLEGRPSLNDSKLKGQEEVPNALLVEQSTVEQPAGESQIEGTKLEIGSLSKSIKAEKEPLIRRSNRIRNKKDSLPPEELKSKEKSNLKEHSESLEEDFKKGLETLNRQRKKRGRPSKRTKSDSTISSGRVTKPKKNAKIKGKKAEKDTEKTEEDNSRVTRGKRSNVDYNNENENDDDDDVGDDDNYNDDDNDGDNNADVSETDEWGSQQGRSVRSHTK